MLSVEVNYMYYNSIFTIVINQVGYEVESVCYETPQPLAVDPSVADLGIYYAIINLTSLGDGKNP